MASRPDIHFRIGQVVICDFGPDPAVLAPPGVMKGPLSVPPEMTKRRPAVVVSALSGTSIVVPLSTSIPKVRRKFHFFVPKGKYPLLWGRSDSWIKADMVSVVSNARLRPLYAGHKGELLFVSTDDFRSIRTALLHALALGELTEHL